MLWRWNPAEPRRRKGWRVMGGVSPLRVSSQLHQVAESSSSNRAVSATTLTQIPKEDQLRLRLEQIQFTQRIQWRERLGFPMCNQTVMLRYLWICFKQKEARCTTVRFIHILFQRGSETSSLLADSGSCSQRPAVNAKSQQCENIEDIYLFT